MKKGTDKIDRFPGTIQGVDKVQYKCMVALVTKLTAGLSGNAVASSIKIESASQLLPDGMYRLSVRGRIFSVRREGGKWPTLQL